jgi:hypothetical protein
MRVPMLHMHCADGAYLLLLDFITRVRNYQRHNPQSLQNAIHPTIHSSRTQFVTVSYLFILCRVIQHISS